MKRRNFLQALAVLTGGLSLGREKVFAGSMESKAFQESLVGLQPLSSRFWEMIKQQFLLPADYDYFNTGGLGASPFGVIEMVKNTTTELEVYPQPGHDMKKWWEIKEKCAQVFSASCSKEEIALTSCATEGNNIVVNGLPLRRGDEIITSTHEHAGLIIPLLNRMQRDGIVIKSFDPDMKSGLGNVERINSLITKRTRLVFVSHFTCTTGQRFPEKEIGQLAKDKGLWFALDGAQTVGNMPINVKKYDCDFYAISGHKWLLGPKRTGIFYVKKNLLDTLRPITAGAYSDESHDIFKKTLTLNPTAQRYEYATENSALYYGLETAIDFMNTIGLEKVWQHNKKLAEQFYRGLQKIPQVEILSPQQEEYRTSLISFKLKNIAYRKAGAYLTEKKRMRVRVVPEAHLDGIRISLHVYNNEEQVERLLVEINKLARGKVF